MLVRRKIAVIGTKEDLNLVAPILDGTFTPEISDTDSDCFNTFIVNLNEQYSLYLKCPKDHDFDWHNIEWDVDTLFRQYEFIICCFNIDQERKYILGNDGRFSTFFQHIQSKLSQKTLETRVVLLLVSSMSKDYAELVSKVRDLTLCQQELYDFEKKGTLYAWISDTPLLERVQQPVFDEHERDYPVSSTGTAPSGEFTVSKWKSKLLNLIHKHTAYMDKVSPSWRSSQYTLSYMLETVRRRTPISTDFPFYVFLSAALLLGFMAMFAFKPFSLSTIAKIYDPDMKLRIVGERDDLGSFVDVWNSKVFVNGTLGLFSSEGLVSSKRDRMGYEYSPISSIYHVTLPSGLNAKIDIGGSDEFTLSFWFNLDPNKSSKNSYQFLSLSFQNMKLALIFQPSASKMEEREYLGTGNLFIILQTDNEIQKELQIPKIIYCNRWYHNVITYHIDPYRTGHLKAFVNQYEVGGEISSQLCEDPECSMKPERKEEKRNTLNLQFASYNQNNIFLRDVRLYNRDYNIEKVRQKMSCDHINGCILDLPHLFQSEEVQVIHDLETMRENELAVEINEAKQKFLTQTIEKLKDALNTEKRANIKRIISSIPDEIEQLEMELAILKRQYDSMSEIKQNLLSKVKSTRTIKTHAVALYENIERDEVMKNLIRLLEDEFSTTVSDYYHQTFTSHYGY